MKTEIKQRIEQIKKGQVPQGYKKTKIGIVPSEWEVKKLKENVLIVDGTHQTPKYISNGVPFVSVENIGNISNTDKYISKEDFEKFKKITCKIPEKCRIWRRNVDNTVESVERHCCHKVR